MGVEVWSLFLKWNLQKVDKNSMMLRHRQHLQKRFAIGPLYFFLHFDNFAWFSGFPCLQSLSFLSFQEKEERELSLVSDSARKLLEESREARRATKPKSDSDQLFDHHHIKNIKIHQSYRSHLESDLASLRLRGKVRKGGTRCH